MCDGREGLRGQNWANTEIGSPLSEEPKRCEHLTAGIVNGARFKKHVRSHEINDDIHCATGHMWAGVGSYSANVIDCNNYYGAAEASYLGPDNKEVLETL